MPKESESKNLYCQDLPSGPSFDLIHVKGGSYFFGDSDIEISLPDFCIGQYPVTQALWQAVMGDNPSNFKGKNRPVESISWYDAATFCNVLNACAGYPPVYFYDKKFQEPLEYYMTFPLEYREDIDVFHNPQKPGYRLPSETQWEYAARGGAKYSAYDFTGSDKLEEIGWHTENSHRETKPVGLKAPNELLIYDLRSNVWEWCSDQWHGDYELKNIPKYGSTWVDDDQGTSCVLRGGSWFNDAQRSRSILRGYSPPSNRNDYVGFRVVLFPTQASTFELYHQS
jgi:formylglycine-generating enzyme